MWPKMMECGLSIMECGLKQQVRPVSPFSPISKDMNLNGVRPKSAAGFTLALFFFEYFHKISILFFLYPHLGENSFPLWVDELTDKWANESTESRLKHIYCNL